MRFRSSIRSQRIFASVAPGTARRVFPQPIVRQLVAPEPMSRIAFGGNSVVNNSNFARRVNSMSRKEVRGSRNGVTLTRLVLFDGVPRRRIGVAYLVQTPQQPKGRRFDKFETARRYFDVQAGLRSKR